MPEERLKLAVFIDFDNIQIGVKDTLGKDFDVSLVLESLKERGEVVAKIAYGDWARAGDYSRQMTQHAIQMVQRSVTPRGDKNGADINLALDALEMAFTRHHINGFAIVGGDSDFMALVEKLKQFDKQVFVVGGRSFTSNILQRNCTEFVAYENLLRDGARGRSSRRAEGGARSSLETHRLSEALPNIQRALKILADRGVAPQLGLLKSTLLQLDSTFSERDYGASSFLEFMQKVEHAGRAHLRRTERGFLVEPVEGETEPKPAGEASTEPEAAEAESASMVGGEERSAAAAPDPAALELLKQALAAVDNPGKPLYMRQLRQRMRAIEPNFDERRYGYRGTMDLLRIAQREGALKLARDHKGIWRIYAASGASPIVEQAASSEESVLAPETATAVEPPERGEIPAEPRSDSQPLLETVTTSAPEFAERVEATGGSPAAEPVPAAEEEKPAEQPRARKPRASRGSAAAVRRRTSSRRKSTEPQS